MRWRFRKILWVSQHTLTLIKNKNLKSPLNSCNFYNFKSISMKFWAHVFIMKKHDLILSNLYILITFVCISTSYNIQLIMYLSFWGFKNAQLVLIVDTVSCSFHFVMKWETVPEVKRRMLREKHWTEYSK